jgi:mannose-6-phosphate isomerase-like protein (cupin superfamily)
MKKKESGDGEDGPGHRPRPPGKGKKLWVADELMTFGTGEETGGTYSLTDSTVLPQGEAPPQIHHREDESFYVLEGEFEFLDRDQWIKAVPDSFVRVPKGSLHTLKNTGEETSRL